MSANIHDKKSVSANSMAISIAILMLAASPDNAYAQPNEQEDEQRYARCVDTAQRAPDRGINQALVWQLDGGGVPARHCEALGLFFAGEYAESAIRLEGIAEDMRIGRGMPVRGDERTTATASMLADTYRQAANAWLRGSELERAESAIEQALAIVPENTALQLSIREDRAYIAAAAEDFLLALEDLDLVYRSDRKRTDLLLFIASAARALGEHDRAESALTQYLDAFPDDPSAYLELGNLKDAVGNAEQARAAWVKVLTLVQSGPDADAARANIERLDVTKPDIQ